MQFRKVFPSVLKWQLSSYIGVDIKFAMDSYLRWKPQYKVLKIFRDVYQTRFAKNSV